MGLLGTLGNIAKAPGSLLWSGLKGAGRNFNRNAMGGLDEIMGPDLTPGMRSVLRAGAMGALGNAIAGKESFGEGVAGNQNRVLGLWQMAQAMKQQKAQRDALGQLGQMDSQEQQPVPQSSQGDGQTPLSANQEMMAKLQADYDRSAKKAEMAMRIGGAAGAKYAEFYQKKAENIAGRIKDYMPTLHGTMEVSDPKGNPVNVMLFKDGSVRPMTDHNPKAQWQLVNLNNKQVLVNMANPAQKEWAMGIAPADQQTHEDRVAELGQKRTEFEKMYPIYQQNSNSTRMGANASAAQAALAGQKFAFDKEQIDQAPMGAVAVQDLTDKRRAQSTLIELSNALTSDEFRRHTGPIKGLSTLPVVNRLFQLGGAYEPAVLNSIIRDARQTIGKSKEGGVLRKEDEEKYKDIMPSMDDSPAVIVGKVNRLNQVLEADVNNFLEVQRATGHRLPKGLAPIKAPVLTVPGAGNPGAPRIAGPITVR